MTDNTTTENTEVDETLEQIPTDQSDESAWLKSLAPEDRRYVLSLREENKKRRVKARELETRLAEIEAANRKEKEVKLAEEGKYKELLEQKELELQKLKQLETVNTEYEETFKSQLDAAMKKLTIEQREIIEDSGWAISKQLRWALRMSDKNLSQTDSPGSTRPGGDIAPTSLNLDEYKGPEGRKKLVALRSVNPKLYAQIIEIKG